MNFQIINDCAGTDAGLPTAGTDPGRRYLILARDDFLNIAFISDSYKPPTVVDALNEWQ